MLCVKAFFLPKWVRN